MSSYDFIYSTPQWSAFCASEKNKNRHLIQDMVVDRSEIRVDPVSKRRFYVCRPTSESAVYYKVKKSLLGGL